MEMEKDFAQFKWEVNTKLEAIEKGVAWMQKTMEIQITLLEKMSVANKRIDDIEKNEKSFEERIHELETKEAVNNVTLNQISDLCDRIRKLEDWQLKIITIASLIASIGAFILNKIF